MRKLLQLSAMTGLIFLVACGESPTPIIGCEASAGIQPDCRFQNPEDLAVLPSNQGLLVSQFGGMDDAVAGNLAFYSPRDGRIGAARLRHGGKDRKNLAVQLARRLPQTPIRDACIKYARSVRCANRFYSSRPA